MPVDYRESTEQAPYKPVYNELLLKQLVQQYNKQPAAFKPELIDQLEKDAQFYGLHFSRNPEDEEFRLTDTIQQAGAGFLSGFSTFHIGDDPKSPYERIARNVGHLAGFVGFVPVKAISAIPRLARLANAAKSIQGKSVPMLAANFATKKAAEVAGKITSTAITGRSSATQTALEFLQKPGVSSVIHDAFHLGVASSVSSWQGGVDEMMSAFVHGAETGAAFRLIGNLIKLPGVDPPRPFATLLKQEGRPQMTAPQQAEVAVRTIASSLYTGLPATIRGETAPEQIYEYLLGAYFGIKMTPTEIRDRDMFYRKVFIDPKNPQNIPELTEGFEELTPRAQKLVKDQEQYVTGLTPEGINLGATVSAEAVKLAGLKQMLYGPDY